MARFHGNTDNNAVTDYTGSSRYSAAVPPLTDDRSGFPGNGGFIHASDAFYHLSIQGMISPASHNTLSPLRNSEMETISSVPLSVSKRAFT